MDASTNPKAAVFAQEHYNNNPVRHLPTYEEATIQYSLRLPTYRSSYVRRFHPYARYVARLGELHMDDDDGDDMYDEVPLDLRALEEQAPLPPAAPAYAFVDDNICNSSTEEPQVGETSDINVANLDIEQERGVDENSSQSAVLRRVEMELPRYH